MSNWLFDFDRQEDIDRYVPTVLDMVKKPLEARKYARKARELVRRNHQQGFLAIENAINNAQKQG